MPRLRDIILATSGLVTSLYLFSPSLAQAQETKSYQIVNSKKYSITPDKVILDEEQNRVTNQNTLRDVMLTYIIEQELQKHRPKAEDIYKELKKARNSTTYREIGRGCVRFFKTPSPSPKLTGILKKLNIAANLTNRAIESFLLIVTNPKMYAHADLREQLGIAERTYLNLFDGKPLTNPTQAKQALDDWVEFESIILAATQTYREVNSSQNPQLKIIHSETKALYDLILMRDTPEVIRDRRDIIKKIQSRTRRTKEMKNHNRRLIRERTKLVGFKRHLLKNISRKFHSNQP